MSDGLLNMKEFSELQQLTKNAGDIGKNLDKIKILIEKLNNNTDKKSIERQKIDAINNLSKVITESTNKIITELSVLTRTVSMK